MADRERILKIRNLNISFKIEGKKVNAIRGVNLDLYKGETIAIVGESGSGKSVTTKAIMGILAKNGSIESGSIDYTWHDPDTDVELLEEVGITNAEKRMKNYPHQLSGGMRQRVVIAIALSCDPYVLICDEPTTALDVTIQAKILELIQDLQKKKGISVIYITHDLGVVAKVADFVNVMYAGKIVETGSIEDIFYRPLHPYTWGLLSAMPDLNTDDPELYTIPGSPPNVTKEIKGDAFAPRNKYALNIDKRIEPPMFKVEGSTTHKVASWLMHPNAPKVEMPEALRKRIDNMMKEGVPNNGQE